MANEDKRIIELPASESILNDDWIGKDSASEGTTKMQLSLLKQLFGGNNFAGEWIAGHSYQFESYVTHEGKLYHNISGGNIQDSTWNASHWSEITVSGELIHLTSGIAPWFRTTVSYRVNDYVIYNNRLYRCSAYHNAGSWNDSHFVAVDMGEELNWVRGLLYSNLAPTFSTGTYNVGDYVVNGSYLYQCIKPHTGGWNAADFRQVKVGDMLEEIEDNFAGEWVANTAYSKDAYVIHENRLYHNIDGASITQSTWSASSWEEITFSGELKKMAANFAMTFNSSTSYHVGQFVVHNNTFYRCNTPHTGAWNWEHFSLTNVSDIVETIMRDFAPLFSTSTDYAVGDYVTYNLHLYVCTTAHPAGTWNASHFTSVKITDIIKELQKNKVNDVQIAGQTTVDENHISDLTSLAIEGTASGEIASFSDGSNLPMPSFVCNIDAVQDLHGQDAPWVGGSGKNKLPMTVDGIKAANTSGTWSGNSYTANGVTFKIQTDNNSNVIGITVDTNGGTASADVIFYLSADSNKGFSLLQGTSYIVTADGATNDVGVRIGDSTDAYVGVAKSNPLTFTADSSNTARIGVNNRISISNITIKPMIRLSTEQDSSFAPYSNICPISGHTGVDAWVRGINLCDEDFEAGGVKNNDGQNTSSTTRIRTKNYIRICPNTSYYGYYGDSTIKMYAFYYDENKTYIGTQGVLISNRVFTTPENAFYMRISTYTNDSPEPSTYDGEYHNNISINYPSTDTEYHAYNPNSQTIQVSWQTEAGEVFGGYVDLVSGVLTVTHKEITYDGVTSGKMFTNKGGGSDNNYYMSCYDGYLFDGETDYNWVNNNAMRNRGLINSHYGYAETSTSIGFRAYIGNNGTALQPRLQFGADSDITTIELANQWLATQYTNDTPWQVKYPLATPITYQLTPTQIKSLLGNNNAWCDTGNVNVKYNKDATTVINSLIARIEALENA